MYKNAIKRVYHLWFYWNWQYK